MGVELNPEQARAVHHRDGPLLVSAGPGSGKTRVLTHRIAHLVESGVEPSSILAITFTNKAADEMLKRSVKLLDSSLPEDRLPLICTFHSYCARLLRRNIYHLPPYEPNFTIYDTSDSKSVIEEVIKELNLDKQSFPPSSCLSQISRWKNDLRPAEVAHDQARGYVEQIMAKVYQGYQKRLEIRNALDFDDLLVFTLRLLQESDLVREREQYFRSYVMIDEFQDTNRPQYHIARLVAGGHQNLCVTGDPDQSIYSWRGASPENFARFMEDFPDYELVELDHNYRSSGNIVKVASRLTGTIMGNRTLRTDNPDGEPLESILLRNEWEEAGHVARRILAMQSEGSSSGEIAILYRINSQSRTIEEELVRQGIPYAVVGGTGFYERKEVKDILAYLRAAAFPRDEVAIRRIINTPSRGIGPASVDRLMEVATQHGMALGEAIRSPEVRAELPTRLARLTTSFASLLGDIESVSDLPLHKQVLEVADRIHYEEHLRKAEPESWSDRIENIRELATAAAETEEQLLRAPARPSRESEAATENGAPLDGPEPELHILTRFLERVALVTDIDAYKSASDCVPMMTLHAAKGLEFDHVCIVGVERDFLPHSRSEEEGTEDEERRLLYVGITRARSTVHLTHCLERRRFNQRLHRLPSPFLDEIAGDGLVSTDKAKPSVYKGWESSRGRQGSWDDEAGDGSWASDFDVWDQGSAKGKADPFEGFDVDFGDDMDGVQPGTRLDHDELGIGVVTSVSGRGASQRMTVHFEDHGEKQFLVAHTPYRILGTAEDH